MDLQIYNSILSQSGIDPTAFDKKKIRQYPNGERAFRHDIFKGKVVWTNDFLTDYKLFLFSYHPLLGLLFSPKHHPYTKRKRFTTLTIMLCVGSFFAALGAFFDNQDDNFLLKYGGKLAASVANGVILFICEASLRLCLQCQCREDIKTDDKCCCCFTYGAWLTRLCKLCTKCALCSWSLVSLSLLIAMFCLVILEDIFSGFLFIFCLQFVCSWTLQCVGLLLKFNKLRKADMKWMDKLPTQDPYNNLFGGLGGTRATFDESMRCEAMRGVNGFKALMKLRKKENFPYYITFYDSNNWIHGHPQYLVQKQKRERCCGLAHRFEGKGLGLKKRVSEDSVQVPSDEETTEDGNSSANGNGSGNGQMSSGAERDPSVWDEATMGAGRGRQGAVSLTVQSRDRCSATSKSGRGSSNGKVDSNRSTSSVGSRTDLVVSHRVGDGDLIDLSD